MEETIKWIDATAELPDSDVDVLVKTKSESYPVWPGYHDGQSWYFADGRGFADVTHWADMPNGPEVAS